MPDQIHDLRVALWQFNREREWEQFHSPKNLATALSVEAAELLEHFQWLTDAQSRDLPADKTQQVADELADVFLYLLNLSDKVGVDLVQAAWRKLRLNAEKYPVAKSRGTMRKYTEL